MNWVGESVIVCRRVHFMKAAHIKKRCVAETKRFQEEEGYD
jgi:hypothetical protein